MQTINIDDESTLTVQPIDRITPFWPDKDFVLDLDGCQFTRPDADQGIFWPRMVIFDRPMPCVFPESQQLATRRKKKLFPGVRSWGNIEETLVAGVDQLIATCILLARITSRQLLQTTNLGVNQGVIAHAGANRQIASFSRVCQGDIHLRI